MKSRPLQVVTLAVLGWVAAVYWVGEPELPGPLVPAPDVAGLLGGDGAGFERATAPHVLEFPRDHGPHPGFRSEWWYLTGNLDDDTGRHYGFQLTFFRFGLRHPSAERESAWAARDIYMGHFALTDVAGRRMVSFERLSRGALGLAGARAVSFEVWIDDWRIESVGDSLFPMRLHARQDVFLLDLSLEQGKPLVLQGDRGLSQKSAERGNASYYYSFTRLPARGRLTLDGASRPVSGFAWMDREWSTSALADDQVGWDWFSIQLDCSVELMFYQLRRSDGSADPHSAGTLVDPHGVSTRLEAREVTLQPMDHWTNEEGISYPVRWRIAVPHEALDLEVTAYVLDQEMVHSVRYWEGAVSVHGIYRGEPVAGSGYLEMTGYGVTRRGDAEISGNADSG